MYTLIAPCHFGLEAVLKREILALGMNVTEVSDGRVMFTGGADAVCAANTHLRTAERVLLLLGRFHAESFEELYQGTKKLPLEAFLPKNARFNVVKAASVRSKLFSPSDIQAVMKKAMVDRMGAHYGVTRFAEDGDDYPFRVFLSRDEVTVALDTTGASLHKRGYRKREVAAPIAENLAAALIRLTPWRAERILVDPFCGSGTIPIEAAMIAANIAPGLQRHFTAEHWTHLFPEKQWEEVRGAAREAVRSDTETEIQGYDISPQAIEIARFSAKEAGVDHLVHFQTRDVKDLSHRKKYGFLITNPPYGERIGAENGGTQIRGSVRGNAARQPEEAASRELFALYRTLGERFRALSDWSLYLITAYEQAEKAIGKKADKNRKIYNGMILTRFYSFPGAKPGKRQT